MDIIFLDRKKCLATDLATIVVTSGITGYPV